LPFHPGPPGNGRGVPVVGGTPFGPVVSALPAEVQEQVRARLITKLGGSGDGVTVRTGSSIAWGVR
jgi:hypothetical protein